MQAKNVLYAAVGAPVVVARKMTDQVNALRDRVSKETSNYTEVAEKTLDGWAVEGHKVISRISEGKVVEEISSKVDLDQAKEQVSRLRDQLEDMLATWRSSFRPEKAEETVKAGDEAPAAKPDGKPAAKKPAAKTSAAKTTKSSAAAKKSPEKPATPKAKAS